MNYVKCHIQFMDDDANSIRQLATQMVHKNDTSNLTVQDLDVAFSELAAMNPSRLEYPTYINDCDAQVGDIVLVPYGRYEHPALVLGESEPDAGINYRPIISILN